VSTVDICESGPVELRRANTASGGMIKSSPCDFKLTIHHTLNNTPFHVIGPAWGPGKERNEPPTPSNEPAPERCGSRKGGSRRGRRGR
ncbi:unnamed protein product, partial [Ectocarpus sp. 6 AP-2014]